MTHSLTAQPAPLTAEEHTELVSYLARRTRDRHLAEDLAQDAIVRLLDFMNRETVANPRALVYRIADNLMLNAMRKAKRRAELHLVADEQPSSVDVESAFLDRERLTIVQAAVNTLPRKRREVLIRRQVHGQNYQEIAAAMGISATSVEKHIVRGIAAVREKIARDARRDARKS